MTWAKKAWTYPSYDTTPIKKLKSKTSQLFFNQNYKTFCIYERFEQLSSSISWQVMVKYVGVKILVHTGLNGTCWHKIILWKSIYDAILVNHYISAYYPLKPLGIRAAQPFCYCQLDYIHLFLWNMAASEFKIFLILLFLLLSFHILKLACFHMSVWLLFYEVFSYCRVSKEFLLIDIYDNLHFKCYMHSCINFYQRLHVATGVQSCCTLYDHMWWVNTLQIYSK